MKTNLLPSKVTLISKLKRVLLNKGVQSQEISVIGELNPLSFQTDFVHIEQKLQNKVINGMFCELERYSEFVSVYVHGSWADETNTPFSDIDDFIILDIESLKLNNQLNKVLKILNTIDMKFCRLDPIQHHGHWICSEEELKTYTNSFIPIYILKDAKIIFGKTHITAKVNKYATLEGLEYNILNTCKSIEKLSVKYFNGTINSYQLKGLVGSFVLMPAFIFQIQDIYLSKPQAILKSNEIYSDEALKCITWSTNNRNNWDAVITDYRFRIFKRLTNLFLNPHLWRKFSNKFSPRITMEQNKKLSHVELTPIMVEKFIKESLKYAK